MQRFHSVGREWELGLPKFLTLISVLILFPILTWASRVQFPVGFQWCVATAAHQIEGANTASDHYFWETAKPDRVITRDLLANPKADRLLKEATGPFESLSIPCPSVADPELLEPELFDHLYFFDDQKTPDLKGCEYSGKAVDHWNRVEEDADLLSQLNAGAYRFSVEWAKVEPRDGEFDQTAIDHYRSEIESLVARNIEPQITLFHFTMPQWLREKGGWEHPDSPQYFERFTRKVYEGMGAKVRVWYTLNEPMVHLSAGYISGVLPPGKKEVRLMIKPLVNLLKAHGFAYHTLHTLASQMGRPVLVGIAHHLRVFDPASFKSWLPNPIEVLGAQFADRIWNWLFVDAIERGRLIVDLSWLSRLGLSLPEDLQSLNESLAWMKGTEDFIGVNYYSRDLIQLSVGVHGLQLKPILNPEARVSGRLTDMYWEIYPEGLARVTLDVDQRVQDVGGRKLPIYISENGLADRSDKIRVSFLESHLSALKKAIDSGADVRGYCHWSLMDNFEWNSGYAPRFGLFETVYPSRERRARPSATWFARTARENGFIRSENGK